MTPRFLMCPPEYWGEGRPGKAGAASGAMNQWTRLYDLLRKTLRFQVELLEPIRGLPYLTFAAHAGFLSKRLFIPSRFYSKQRRGEETVWQTWFRKKGYIVKPLDALMPFEGSADLCRVGETLYAGFRSPEGLTLCEGLEKILKQPCFGLQITDPAFPRLSRCLAPLSEKSALGYPKAFETCSAMILKENIPDLIEVPEEEALRGGCDLLAAGGHGVLSEHCPKTAKALARRKIKVHSLNLFEFEKAGAGPGSLALRLS